MFEIIGIRKKFPKKNPQILQQERIIPVAIAQKFLESGWRWKTTERNKEQERKPFSFSEVSRFPGTMG